MKNESIVVRFVKGHRFALLLCVLIAEIFASPAADYHPRVGGVLTATMCLILLGASGALANKQIPLIVLVAVRWLVARALEAFVGPPLFPRSSRTGDVTRAVVRNSLGHLRPLTHGTAVVIRRH
jgi:hypothetical protein